MACPEKQVPLLAAEGGGAVAEDGWLDVTATLDATAGELAVGQMVHAPSFSLLSAMSALEVMDPKMDAGMITDTVTADKALGTPLMPRELTAGQIVHIMDQIMVCEMHWLAGHSLAQSVFTCLYLHDIKNVADRRFAAMAQAVLKCCAIVRNMVVQADFYEEEDFVPQTFGFSMCEMIPEPEILAELARAEDRLSARIKWLKMTPEERSSASEAAASVAEAARRARVTALAEAGAKEEAEGCESVVADGSEVPLPADVQHAVDKKAQLAASAAEALAASTEALPCAAGEDEAEVADALRARVSYRRGFLNLLFQLANKGAKGIEPARRAVKFAQTQLAAVAKTVSVGTTASEASENKSIGFQADVNRRLLGPAPPRAMDEMSLAQAVAAAESFLGDMTQMLEVTHHATSMTAMVEFFAQFSDHNPNVVASSILMVVFYDTSRGTVLGKDRTLASVLLADGADFGVPAKLDMPPRPADALDTDGQPVDETAPFWELFERTILYAFRILCKNNARQHRKLGRIVQSWSQLQEEAHYLDSQASVIVENRHVAATNAAQANGTAPPPALTPPPQVYQWYTLKWTIYFMLRHLLCGFELELYPQAEWRLIYWYADHLVTHRLHALMLLAKAKAAEEAKAAEKAAAARPQSAPVGSSKKKGKKGKKGKEKEKDKGKGTKTDSAASSGYAPEGSAQRVDQVLMEAQRSLCAGSFRMISGLWLTRQLELPDPLFVEQVMPLDTQQRLKFEHRFHPFRQLIQPKPLEYAQYVNDCTIPPTAPPVAIFKQAVECFKRCQVNVDKLRAIAKTTPGPGADAGGIIAAAALTETCEKWKEVCVRNSVMLVGLMRSPAQLQKVVAIDLSAHKHFPTGALGEGIVQPLEPAAVDEETSAPTDAAGDRGSKK